MDSQNGIKAASFDAQDKRLCMERLKFRFEHVQLQFDLRNDLSNLLVANNFMYIFTSSSVYRIDLNNPSDVTRVSVPLVGDNARITRSWIHQNGRYLLIQVNRSQYFVLHLTYRKFKVLPRLKGLDICSVAFGNSSDDMSTDFVLATSEGNVYVGQIKCHDPTTQENKRDDKICKQLFTAKAPAVAISYSHKFRKIQLFLESRMLVWDCVEPVLEEMSRSLRQHPISSDLSFSALRSGAISPLFLALLDYYYYISPETAEFASNDEEAILANGKKLPVIDLSLSRLDGSLFMTPHHYVHLVQKHRQVFAIDKLLSQDPVIRDVPGLATGENVLGLVADYTAETYWLYTTNNIHEMLFSNEAASVWHSYYKMENYEKALEVLNSVPENSVTWFQKNVVMVKQGYDMLQKGGFGIECEPDRIREDSERFEIQKKGIIQLAKLQEAFEKVCLLLMNNNELNVPSCIQSNRLLLEYLTIKFGIAKRNRNKIQQVALSSWIVKLYLRIMYTIQRTYLNSSEGLPEPCSNDLKRFWEKQRKETDEALTNFLSTNHRSLDQLTIYQLMKELGFYDKVITFAELLQDYEYIFEYNIDIEDWSAALKPLAQLYAKDPVKGKSVVYRTSEMMLIYNPKQTVDMWLRLPELDFEMLLPAILSYNKNSPRLQFSQNHSIYFLQRLIFEKNFKSINVNNYYLSLVISYFHDDEESLVETALSKAVEFFQSEDLGYRKGTAYHKDLILRLSLKYKRYKTAVLILIKDMNLHEVALNIALNHELTSLGEFVLKSYDDYMLEDMTSGVNDFIIEDTSTEDSKVIGKIKLEDESFASRRKLWIIYAKYIVDRVFNGHSLDIAGLRSENKRATVTKNKPEQNGVQHITEELIGGDQNELVPPDLQNSRLNRALQYLLHLSYSHDRTSNVLKLKDLLPLFPESIKIFHFREEIVESLNLYNNKINQLGLEMQELASTAQKLKKQINQDQMQTAKGTIYTVIEPGESCRLCDKLLVDKNFLVFPNCHHGFHKDCTVRFYLQLKGDYRFKKMFQSFKQTSSVEDKAELDRLLQRECLLCNDSLLNKIEDPLVVEEKEKLDWEV